MPPTLGKRPLSQTVPEPPPEQPIQSTAIVVIHPGSLNLRIGRASDAYPQTIPHCIARRHKQPGLQHPYEDPWLIRKECIHSEVKQQQKAGLKLGEEAVRFRPNLAGEYRQPTSAKQLASLNQRAVAEHTDILSPLTWTNIQPQQEYFIGSQALYIQPSDCYDIHWPIRRGLLNLHRDSGGCLTSVLADLELIWGYAIKEHLDIPLKDLKHYRAVLLVPDIYQRSQIKALMNILLDKLGFAAAFPFQENVSSSFGAGMLSACVIDIGDQKTSVCCVDDGISQKATRLCLSYGGSDVTRCFHWLLQRAAFPYRECDLGQRMDAIFLQELKERLCHMDVEKHGFQEVQMQVKHPGNYIVNYNMQLGDEAILASMSLFYPDMFGLNGNWKNWWRVQKKGASDPEDLFDDDYLSQTQSRQEQAARIVAARKKETAEVTKDPVDLNATEDSQMMDDEDTNDQTDMASMMEAQASSASRSSRKVDDDAGLIELGSDVIGIDQAILMSIDKCDSDETKRKMYSCIVVVGGGASKFQGAEGWIKYAVWTQMPPHFRVQLETMDVITSPKEMDPQMTAWKGGSLLSCLDTSQELWIWQSEWNKCGAKILRERVPFVW